jgi:hypothetical protein
VSGMAGARKSFLARTGQAWLLVLGAVALLLGLVMFGSTMLLVSSDDLFVAMFAGAAATSLGGLSCVCVFRRPRRVALRLTIA